MYQLPKNVNRFGANHGSLSSLGIQLLLCPCITTPVVAELKDQPLLFQPCTLGNRGIVVLEIRKISVTYIPEVQLIKRRLFFREKGKVLNAFFVCEAGTPVECLYLVI